MAAFLMQSRDNPMKALGMVTGIISILVGLTVFISTAMFMRNTKLNRIMPERRIIRRRPQNHQPWTFRMPFLGSSNRSEKFLTNDLEKNSNQNINNPCSRPLPPRAPCLPPPTINNARPSERPKAVPTVSGTVSSKGSKKSSHSKENNVSSALVSELKMRLEQKIIESNQGYH